VAVIRPPSLNRLTWTVCGWFVLAAGATVAQQPEKWKTGAALQHQLGEQAGVTWQDRGLRDGLVRLSQKYGVAIFLDRRIDPDQELTLVARDQSLEEVLRRISADAHAGIAIVGPVIYFGPPETASKLATLAALRRQDASKLSSDIKTRLLRADVWQSDELTQPRQLLDGLARQAGMTLENGDIIPFDLWPAVSLPPLAWTDRLSLLVAGFGLTYEIGDRGTSLRLVPQPTAVALEKIYTPRGNAASLAAQLGRVLPDAKIHTESQKLVVTASQEDHEKIDRLLSGQTIRTAKPAKKVGEKLYTLHTGKEPAGEVVSSVAKSIGKKLEYDASVLNKLKSIVQIDQDNVTLEYLLETTLQPLGLTYRLTDESLEIVEVQNERK
jgi:hypothetical protein